MASSIPLTAAITSPRFIVLRPKLLENTYVSYKDGHAVIGEEGVFSPLVKIEVESATNDARYIHLRFCYSNRYIGRSDDSEIPVAASKQPDEDMKKTTSTLFELRNGPGAPDKYYFCHVQSQTFLQLNDAGDTLLIKGWRNVDQLDFELVDWDTLVKLPKHVAFKGDNNRYLRGYLFHDLQYLTFDATDPNNEIAGHEIELLDNGYVKIKSLHFSGYWRNGDDWIWADNYNTSTTDKSLLFWPVDHGHDTISLRSAQNNKFCRRLTADNKDDCLNASAETTISQAKFVIQELVGDRKIYDVTYRMDDARIFGEKIFVAGTVTGENNTDSDSTIAVSVEYKDSRSYSFSRSSSINAGVKTTIEADVLEINKESIEVAFHVTGKLEWGKTTTIEKFVLANGTVAVPAKTRAIFNYVGIVGTCNVPFSYRQEDKSSTDGKITTTEEIDGVFTGINSYNFTFQLVEYQPL